MEAWNFGAVWSFRCAGVQVNGCISPDLFQLKIVDLPAKGQPFTEIIVFTLNLSGLDLQILIAGCIRNNQRDQKFLYEKYYGYCLKTVFRYIYHYDKAVDAVNDGFVKIFRNIERFQFRD